MSVVCVFMFMCACVYGGVAQYVCMGVCKYVHLQFFLILVKYTLMHYSFKEVVTNSQHIKVFIYLVGFVYNLLLEMNITHITVSNSNTH